ncbi:DUF4231 domain-containing protein [Streptomyces sp. NPDC051133]|uniref:DUF4231 domain-containing protein n=1 Tax=Streptomyces sp. NPDC051133 TaxID=3155521 RepID=UPI00342ED4BD
MTGGTPTSAIKYGDFPALYRAADSNSLSGQRRYLRTTRLQLGSLVAASLFAVFAWRVGRTDVAAVLAAVAFATALVSEIYMLKERPDREWYTGRAVAESAKTLTWRYLVGGTPLRVDADGTSADTLLLQRFAQIEADVPGLWLIPDGGSPEQITPAMRRIRELPLAERRAFYLAHRINDQLDWYRRKARWNARVAVRWSVTLAVLELLGLAAGIARAAGMIDVDLMGFAAALAAAGTAWVQAKQHQNLATAYAVTGHELSAIAVRVPSAPSEETWASFVADAEEAISREHTLWRASHGG